MKSTDAVAAEIVSEIGSAQYTPITPIKRGRMMASGINRIILRSTAINREIFACPSARKVGWIPFCRPNTSIPAIKIGITSPVSATSCVSLVKNPA